MLAIALVSLSLAVAPNPPPSAQKPDAVDLHHGKAAPPTAHPNNGVSPPQSQTPAGVIPSGTVDRLHLDRQHQISSGAAREAGADSHPEPACTRREARAGRCILRPGKHSTRSGNSTRGASDTTPPVTPP